MNLITQDNIKEPLMNETCNRNPNLEKKDSKVWAKEKQSNKNNNDKTNEESKYTWDNMHVIINTNANLAVHGEWNTWA